MIGDFARQDHSVFLLIFDFVNDDRSKIFHQSIHPILMRRRKLQRYVVSVCMVDGHSAMNIVIHFENLDGSMQIHLSQIYTSV